MLARRKSICGWQYGRFCACGSFLSCQALKIERSSLVVGAFDVAGITICLLSIAPRNSLNAKTVLFCPCPNPTSTNHSRLSPSHDITELIPFPELEYEGVIDGNIDKV